MKKDNRKVTWIKGLLVLAAFILMNRIAFAQESEGEATSGSDSTQVESTSGAIQTGQLQPLLAAPIEAAAAAAAAGGGGSNPPADPNPVWNSHQLNCANTVISYNSTNTAPSGVVWFWQDTQNGIDVDDQGSSYTVTSTGTYYLRAYRPSSDEWSEGSASVYVGTVHPLPDAPDTRDENVRTPDSFNARWYSVSGANSYRLDVSTNSSFTNILSNYNNKIVYGTSHTVSGLSPGDQYFYRLRSRDGNTCISVNSTSIDANTTMDTPTASNESTKTTSSFKAKWNSVDGADEYLLYVSTVNDFSSHLTNYNGMELTGTSHTLSNLESGKRYYYRVKAKTDYHTTGYSNTITANTKLETPIAEEMSCASEQSFTAKWGAVHNATQYKLYVSTSSDFSSHVSGYDGKFVYAPSTSHEVSGLTPGKYYYRVKAQFVEHTTNYSNSITAKVLHQYDVTGGAVCEGETFNVGLTDSQTGVTYQLHFNGQPLYHTEHPFSGQMVKQDGTGVAIAFHFNGALDGFTDDGTYTVVGVVGTCETQMDTSAQIVRKPVEVTVNGGGDFCVGDSVAISIGSAEPGVIYELIRNNSPTGQTIQGETDFPRQIISGTYTVKATREVCSLTLTESVTATMIQPPAQPTITSSDNICGDKTISPVTAQMPDPSTSIFWRWQGTDEFGTSQSAFSAGIPVSSSGAYYVRAYDYNTECWSVATEEVVTVNPNPAEPSTTITEENLCGTTKLTWDGTPASGKSWYWQINEGNEDTAPINADSTYERTSGTTMYLKAQNDVTGCWSDAKNVAYTVRSIPAMPWPPTLHQTYCDSAIIEYDSMTVRGKNWYWQVNATDTAHHVNDLVDTVRSRKFYEETEVYVRSYDNNSACWSDAITLTGILGPYPIRQFVSDDVVYCEGFPVPLEFFMSASEPDVTYELYKDDVYVPSEDRQGDAQGDSLMWKGLTLGTYHVVGDRDGCRRDMYRTVSMIENPQPTADAGGNITIFNDDIIMLPYADVSGSVWSSSEASVANNYYNARLDGPGAYNATYTFTNTSGCTDDDDIVITVVDSPDDIAVTSGSRFINVDPQASVLAPTLTAPTGYTYQWYKDGEAMTGETSHTLSPNEVGVYEAEIMTTSGYGIRSNAITVVPLRATDNVNHIITHQLREAWTNESSLPTTSTQITNKYDFMDDLGRPVQTVIDNQSVSGKDMVQPMAYDAYGRSPKAYLPYTNAYGVVFKNDAIAQQADFYATASNIDQDDYPYSENTFENSPLNRVLKTNAPGEAWAKNGLTTEGKPVTFGFSANTANEVPNWEISGSDVVKSGHYPAGTLNKSITTDENGHQVQEFTNLQGQVVLKKVQISTTAPTTDSDWYQTFYVYDKFNNLRYVLPPQAVVDIGAATTVSSTIMEQFVFQYEYDERQRMIIKQVPGANPVHMVYDQRDRLVMTQDGNQRANGKWSFTKYDELNRPVMTGIIAETDNRSTLQGELDTWQQMAESYTGTGSLQGYDGQGYPSDANASDLLTVTYYDDYGFTGDTHWTLGDFTDEPEARTLVTGSLVKVPGQTDWNQMITLYDEYFRVGKSVSLDYQNNRDSLVNEYYSDVLPLVTKTTHIHMSALTNDTTTIVKDFTYDHADRLLSVSHKINDEAAVVILENEYNELGELITKKLNKEGTNQFTQEVDYQYNIRGWLTKINDPAISDPAKYLAMELKYDAAGQYNGNIGAIDWKNPFETSVNTYEYAYDPVNRLKSAEYNNAMTAGYSVSNIDYDANGNILALARYGDHDSQADQLFDDLDYDYVGNQLTKVTDASGFDTGFKDGANMSTEYVYDANGNMYKDENKGIDSIAYNHLNLPIEVWMNNDGSNRIEYIYDAAGVKLAQLVYGADTLTKRIDYQGAFIYEDSVLQFIQHEEGRIVYETDVNDNFVEYEYQYHLKDHLGNVRATFKEDSDIEESLATFESSAQSNEMLYFTGYDSMTLITSTLFNHTSGGNTAIRLDGSANETEGLGKSLKVKPGDVIDMEVYAKYYDESESGTWVGTLGTIASQIASGDPTVIGEGGGMGLFSFPFLALMDTGGDGSDGPDAYMNYMIVDEYDNVVTQGYVPVTSAAKEDGSDVAHEYLTASITIDEPGLMYVYLSNENSTPIDVFFDDFKVTQNHTKIVSKDDYYPFGLTFGGYSRPAETAQNFKYNGKEKIDDLGVNWSDYGARMYMADLGRFVSVDPIADIFSSYSPYNYSQNNPIRFVDVDGLGPGDRVKNAKKAVQADVRKYKQVIGEKRYSDDYVDCSEFCREIAMGDGYDPGDWTGAQADYYKENGEWVTDINDVRPGDFLFWSHKDEEGITHTGVATEVGEDGRVSIIQSTRNAGGESINDKYKTNKKGDLWSGSKFESNFVGAGRPEVGPTLDDKIEVVSSNIGRLEKKIARRKASGKKLGMLEGRLMIQQTMLMLYNNKKEKKESESDESD